eukprot:1619601-Rhodomonas_salina.1
MSLAAAVTPPRRPASEPEAHGPGGSKFKMTVTRMWMPVDSDEPGLRCSGWSGGAAAELALALAHRA